MKQPTFTLPVDEYIDVRRIPKMLAEAKYPNLQQPQQVTQLCKRVGRATLDLDDADRAVLSDAWQPLPWPTFPLDADKWQPYADALATTQPPFLLVTMICNPQYVDGMLRMQAWDEYGDALKRAMLEGTLEWRRELTLLPVPPKDRLQSMPAALALGGYVVSRDALREFAKGAGFKVQRQGGAPITPVLPGHNARMAEARANAKALFLDREGGKLSGFPRDVDFAAECVKRWSILKQSTITQKWIPQWRRELRESRK